MIRPEIAARLRPWREVLIALAVCAFGLWVFSRGGLFFQPLGLAILAVAAIWVVTALRKRRFLREVAAPGLVEIDEAAIRYYGARILGGEVSLNDLSEIRLLRLSGKAHWRLKTADGQALLIPLNAAGAEALADAFATLPGIRMGHISAAIGDPATGMQTLWTRPGRGGLT